MSDKDDSSQNLFQIGQLFQRSKYIKKVYKDWMDAKWCQTLTWSHWDIIIPT